MEEKDIISEPQKTDGGNEQTERKKFPLWAKILYIIAAFSAIVLTAAVISPTFADFYNRYIGSLFRGALAHLTGWIPFSLAESMLLLIPVIAAAIIIWVNKYYDDSWRELFRFIGLAFSVASVFFSIFVLGFGTGYHGTELEDKLKIQRVDVCADELYQTAQELAAIVNENAPLVKFDANGQAIMPYSYSVMSQKLVEAYDSFCDDHSFIPRLSSRVKPVMLSKPWTYTHIAGVYTYFTGEANINTNFPDYTLPFTAAHEMAHQRGVAREDEANFVAFLVCMESSDPYIRYSGALNLYEYVSGALAVADQEKYIVAHTELCREALGEIVAYGEFYEKYRESVASDITGAVNDTFLKLQGTEGTASYGLVVDLAVAYFKAN